VPSGILPIRNSRPLWYDEIAKLVSFLANHSASPFDAPIFVSVGGATGSAPVSGAVWVVPAFAGGVTW
jgi:hypothetical protein